MNTRIFCCSTIRLSATLWAAVMLCLTLATSATAASYTVTVSSDGKNAVGNGTYTEGTTVSVTAGTHPDGIPFKKWTVQKGGVKVGDAYSEKTTFVMPKRNVTLIAEFGILGKKAMNAAADDSVSYGGKKYGWVTIGTRKWMTENLNYTPEAGNSWCYGNNADSCVKYGRLYDWATAMGEGASNTAIWSGNSYQHQGICPVGWRLPNNEDWTALVTYAGTNSGTKLKAKSGWSSGNGTDDYGFSALPGGYSYNNSFYDARNRGEWWSSTPHTTATNGYFEYMTTAATVSSNYASKSRGESVRCVAYTQEKYTVSINGDGGAGATGGNYKPGDTVTVSAGTPNEGRKFLKWTTSSVGVTFTTSNMYSNPTTFAMPGNDVTVTAVYGPQYTVELTGVGAGAAGGGQYFERDTVKIKAGMAPKDMKFLKWTSVGVTIASTIIYNDSITFLMPGNNVTVTAVFGPKYSVEIVSSVAGAVVGDGQYFERDTVKLKAGRVDGKKFKKWTTQSNGVTIANAYGDSTTFIMPGNPVTVTAEWYEDVFTATRNGKTQVYGKVKINDRWWMAENLNYDTLNNTGSWCSGNSAANCVQYGRLYDWNTAMGIDKSYTANTWKGFDFPHQGICPDGWHLPNKAEFDELVAYAGGSAIAGKKLKEKSGWTAYSGITATDDFGFSAKAGGNRRNSSFYDVGSYGNWWASTWAMGSAAPYSLRMYYSGDAATVDGYDKSYGTSVRCVAYLKDKFKVTVNGGSSVGDEFEPKSKVTITAGTPPDGKFFSSWTTNSPGVVFADPFSSTTTFTMPGGNDVTVTANFAQKYKVDVVNAGENAGSGEYIAGGLVTITLRTTPKDKKFKMWTADGKDVTFNFAYGATTTFIMPAHDVTVSAEFGDGFTDSRNGKTYRWVSIGKQRWMAENLNIDPKTITPAQKTTNSWCYDNDTANCNKYGRLYDWATAMNIEASYNTAKWNDGGNTVVGVCPSGWHLPNAAEWNELLTYVGSATAGKSLLAANGWENSSYGNGNDGYDFTGLPAGYYSNTGVFADLGKSTAWWAAHQGGSATGSGAYNGGQNTNDITLSGPNKTYGYSVRCVASNKAQITMPTPTPDTTFIYNGKVQSAGLAENDHYTVINGTARDAGSYTARVVLKDTLIYEWADANGSTKPLEYIWKIEKAEPRPFVRPDAARVVYSPGLKLVDVSLPAGYTWADSVKATVLKETDDGRSFAATYNDPNYDTAYGYITVKYVDKDEPIMYKVVVSNGGTGASVAKEYAKGAEVTVTAGTHPQKLLFRRWMTQSNGVTFADESNATTTFTMPENDVTVTANWVMSFVDNRDKKTYKMVNIGNQRWMAENLNYDTLNGTGSQCGDNDCAKYGRFYNWTTAMAIDQSYGNTKWEGSDFQHRGVCPSGWHLPDTAEWNSLINEVGGFSIAGKKLKATSGWAGSGDLSGGGTDDYGFSALPNSAYGYIYGQWWSTIDMPNPEYNSWGSYILELRYSVITIARLNDSAAIRGWARSIKSPMRCLADKQVVAKPTVTNPALVYNGHDQWPGIPASPYRAYEVVGDNATNAGTYTATVTLDTANFVWSDGTTDRVLKLTWSISPAPGKFIPWEKDTVYSSALKLSDLTLPPGYAWISPTVPSDHLSAGNGQKFAASFKDTSGNYTAAASGFITVNVAKSSALTASDPPKLVIRNDNVNVNVFDLSTIVLDPTDHGDLVYSLGASADTGGILKVKPSISNDTVLSYQGIGKTSGTATQEIKITAKNYEDIVVVFVFEATVQPVYKVTVTGGAATKSGYPEGEEVEIVADPAEPGKYFVKWTTADGVFFSPDSSASSAAFTMPAKDVAVAAVYRDTSYTVMFMADGGTLSPSLTSAKTVFGTGKLASLPTSTKVGYTFVGWYTFEGNSADTSTRFKSDAAIYAHWNIIEYKVTWKSEFGAPMPVQNIVTYIGSVAEPEKMVEVGYRFDGWYVDSLFKAAAKFPIEKVAADVTLYAKWEINSYVVRWHTNNGSPVPVNTAVTYGGSIAAPISAALTGSKAGYAFDGWYFDEGLDVYAAFPIHDVTGPMDFYAKWVPVHTITFNPDGGTVSPASALTGAGGKLVSLPTPVKSGYIFDGWYTDKGDGGERVTENTPFTGNAAIYAHWTLKTYTVSFIIIPGNVEPASMAVVPGGKLTSLPVPVPPACEACDYVNVFDGWYTAGTGGTKVDLSRVYNADTDLYGRWKQVKIYAITFDPNGGAVSPAAGATGGDSALVKALPVPTRDGYTFIGWYTAKEGGKQVTTGTKFVESCTIYARWTTGAAVSYTVKFNANGGTVSPASAATGLGGMLSTLPVPTRSGYAFDGWYTTLTGGSKVTEGTEFTSNDEIYARWTLLTYTITFLPSGGTVNPTSIVISGVDGRLSYLPTPKLDLYAFDGWYTAPVGGEKITTGTVFDSDAAAIARWIKLYIVRFNANGGTVSPAVDTTGANGKLAALPVPKPAANGETFNGWFTSPVGGARVTEDYAFSGDITLYAQWSPAAVAFTVTFNPNGGLVNPTTRVTSGNGTLSALPVPVRDGYAFVNWYTSATVGSTVITTSTVFESNATIFARWTPIYTVTFNANSGTVSPANAKTDVNGLMEGYLPVPTRSGYQFEGWYTTSASTGGLEVTESYVFSANTTIYARWTLVTYTISFDANGGTVTVSSGVTGTGGRLSSLPTPASRTGYVFDGWYTEYAGGTKVTTSTAFSGDATVYAKWSPVYKVTFDPVGGTVTPSTANTGAGGKLSSLPTPTLKDYTFVSWYTATENGARVTTSTVFTGDATVYAVWSLFTHAKVTFGSGSNGTLRATVNGVPIAPGDSVGVGKDIVFTAVPAEGYTVSSWRINGTEIADTFYTYVHAGLSDVTTVSVTFERSISISSPNREIPIGKPATEVAVAPVKPLSGNVTVGPNPVRYGSEAAIYWTGGKAVSGKLSVFDAVGQKVAVVDVSGAKKIGEWKVGDIAEGTYLIRGVLKDKNGVKVKVSVLVGVVR